MEDYREKEGFSSGEIQTRREESIFHSSHSTSGSVINVLKLQQRWCKWTLEKNCEPLEQIAWEDCGISIFRVPCKAQINYV